MSSSFRRYSLLKYFYVTIERNIQLRISHSGCDCIYHYNKTEAGLQRLEDVKAGPGRGPRHLLLLPERSLALVVCELENFLQVYRLNNQTGGFILLKELFLVSVKNNAGAEILLHSNRKWVYVSSRGDA